MGLHVVAMAKFHLQLASHSLSPTVVAGIVCPLALKLLMSLKMFREEALYTARFFFFRMRQIAFNREEIAFGNGSRLERALRLIGQTVSTTSTTTTPSDSEDTFNTLSMIAL